MKCQLLFLLGVFINISLAKTDDDSQTTLIEGYLLCKSCGEDSSVLNLIDNTRISDYNIGLSNITISDKEVLVQEVQNPRGIVFKILISKRARCAPTSGWFTEATWFEGFAWKVCQCPTCKAHLGWMFEPIESATQNPVFPSEKGFYSLILDTVILESYVNSLLIVDKVLRN